MRSFRTHTTRASRGGRAVLAAAMIGALVGAVGPGAPSAHAADVLVLNGAPLSLAGSPNSVSVDGPGGRGYVVLQGLVQTVDLATMTSLGTTATSAGSYGSAVDPVRHRLFVGDFNSGQVTIFDISGPLPVPVQTVFGLGSGLGGLDVNPIDGRVYGAVENGCKCVRVLVPGVSSYSVAPAIPIITGPPVDDKPNDVSVDWAANRLYVSVHHTANGIGVVDLGTNTVSFQPSLSGDIFGVAAAPNHNAVFAGGFGAGITRLDGATFTAANVGGSGQVPFLSFDPASDRLYAASMSSSALHVVDGATNAIATISLGAGTFNGGVAAVPGTGCALAALRAPNQLRMVCGAPATGAAPTVTPTVVPAANAAGWHNSSPVGITFSVDDHGYPMITRTGCGATSQVVDTSGATFTCTATNGAGYPGSGAVSVKLDTVDPVVGFVGLAPSYGLTDTIAASCSFSDDRSGVSAGSESCLVPTGPAASYIGGGTAQASADDVAGNSAIATQAFTVVVDAAGICDLSSTYTDQSGSLCAAAASIASAPNEKAKAGKLKAFINHVEAQRGKKLTNAEADALIAAAQALVDPRSASIGSGRAHDREDLGLAEELGRDVADLVEGDGVDPGDHLVDGRAARRRPARPCRAATSASRSPPGRAPGRRAAGPCRARAPRR